jgi:hypothetical protein
MNKENYIHHKNNDKNSGIKTINKVAIHYIDQKNDLNDSNNIIDKAPINSIANDEQNFSENQVDYDGLHAEIERLTERGNV